MIYEIINTYRNVSSKYLNLSAEELTVSMFFGKNQFNLA